MRRHPRSVSTLKTPFNPALAADLAFIVIISFTLFLVPSEEHGFLVKMGSWSEEPPDEVTVKERNVCHVALLRNKVFVDWETIDISELSGKCKTFISNLDGDEYLAESSKSAMVVLMFDCSTAWETYLSVYNELKKAYNELWDETAQQDYGKKFNQLSGEEKRAIKGKIPFVIHETMEINGCDRGF